MANDVKKEKKKSGATVADVLVPGQGGASMIEMLTEELKKALAGGNQKKKD